MTSGMGMRVLPTLLTRVSSTSMKITEGLLIGLIVLKWVDGCQKGRLKNLFIISIVVLFNSVVFVKTGLLVLPYPFFPTLEQGGL